MFDIAYLPEASVEAMLIEKSKLWEKILKIDLSKPGAGFIEGMELAWYNEIGLYWSIIYYTHGGI